jgi:predicted nucleic acid-binding protein
MRIYLDTCTIQRPVDESQEPRVQREAKAMMELIELAEAGEVEFVRSRVLLLEHAHNANHIRWVFVERVLSLASEIVEIDPQVEERTLRYRALGLKGMDAVHLACAAQTRSLEELTDQAMDLLCRELGVANTLRFLRQFIVARTGDYTKERDALIGHLSVEEIFAEARRLKEAEASR